MLLISGASSRHPTSAAVRAASAGECLSRSTGLSSVPVLALDALRFWWTSALARDSSRNAAA